MLGSRLIFILREGVGGKDRCQSATGMSHSRPRKTHLFSASCSPQHVSQKNLFF